MAEDGNGRNGRNGNGSMPWWARLPTTKLVVVGTFGLAYKYGDSVIQALILKICT